MANTKRDVTSYENCDCKHEIFNLNNLYAGFQKAKENSDWKAQVQRYEMNLLPELCELHKEIKEKSFEFLPPTKFIINERGKTRLITGEQIRDRVAKSVLCEEGLWPIVSNYLIYDNGASLKGKGISFTRNRLKTHLRKYYQQTKSNKGYVLLIDFTKYFDNIQHEPFVNMFKDYGIDDDSLWLLEKTVKQSRVDVSYMDDFEYEQCMDKTFNSLEYSQVNNSLLVQEKYMDKHFNIGCPVAQVAGVAYPTPVDNYIKIVRGIKFFARYMDDSYIIHESKEYLQELLVDITEEANKIGIKINSKKTRICKLSEHWRFLQIQYSLTETGRIIEKINPKRLTNMRRKLKKLALFLEEKDFDDLYKSWFKNHYKIMSKRQRKNMDELYFKLKGEHYA